MNLPWSLYFAWKQLFPSRRWASFFSILAIFGVALGVGVLLVVQCVMNGFQDEIRRKILLLQGDVEITADGQILTDVPQTLQFLQDFPEVEMVAPYAAGIAMMQFDHRPAFPQIKGISSDQRLQLLPLQRFLREGSADVLAQNAVLVGSGLAEALHLQVGDRVEFYAPTQLQRLENDEVLLPLEVSVGGVFETGWNRIDSNTVLIPLEMMDELYGLEGGVHGFEMRLRKGVSPVAFSDRLNGGILPDAIHARSWIEANQDLLYILRMEKSAMFFVLLFILLVASFSITSSLMTSVVRRTREVGLLRALGAGRWSVAGAFAAQGVIIGIIGTFLGVIGGLLMLLLRDPISSVMMHFFGAEDAMSRFYEFSHLPASYYWGDFVLVGIFSVLMAGLAGILPAYRVLKMNAADALRYE